jgi:hypothetical protein
LETNGALKNHDVPKLMRNNQQTSYITHYHYRRPAPIYMGRQDLQCTVISWQ